MPAERKLSPNDGTLSPAPSAPAAATHARVFLLFNDQRIAIDGDQFIIGRGPRGR